MQVSYPHNTSVRQYVYREAQSVEDNSKYNKTDYVTQVQDLITPEGFKNSLIGSKVTAILMDRQILHSKLSWIGESLLQTGL